MSPNLTEFKGKEVVSLERVFGHMKRYPLLTAKGSVSEERTG